MNYLDSDRNLHSVLARSIEAYPSKKPRLNQQTARKLGRVSRIHFQMVVSLKLLHEIAQPSARSPC